MTAGRVAWTALGSLLAVPTLVFGTFSVVSGIAHRSESLTLTFPAGGIDAIDVDTRGVVIVRGADVDEITVSMHISHGLTRTRHTEQVVNRTLMLESRCSGLLSQYCQVDPTIVVPFDTDVFIDSDNDLVQIRDLAGNVFVDNDNGRIEAAGLRSDVVDVSNDNAAIDLDFAAPPRDVRVGNDNGSIRVVVPDVDGAYAVTTQNDNGSIDVDIATDPDSPRSISAENDNGSIELLPR